MTASAEYREWRPPRPLAGRIACVWTGVLADDGTPFTDSVLPDGCIDLVWDGRDMFVAGPDSGPVPIARTPGAAFAGVRFRPGAAPAFLGVPACALLDQRVDAADLLGDRAGASSEALARARSPRDAAATLERAVLDWLPRAAPPDRLVEAAVARLTASTAASPVTSLASDLGVSERHLHRRCTGAVGYGPKMLHRVLRFRRFLALAERSRQRDLAGLAASAGYADQAHLTRETRRLAGASPARFLARRLGAAASAPTGAA